MSTAPALAEPSLLPIPLHHDELTALGWAAASGDDRAVSALVAATQARLRRTALRILRDPDVVEDVVVTAYTRAILALRGGKFRFDAPVGAWLDRIVTLGAIDALRSRRRAAPGGDAEVDLVDAAPSPEEVVIARTDARRVAEVIASLPPRQRTALLHVELDGLSPTEAATRMGCSVGAIELLLVRARRTLRAETGR